MSALQEFQTRLREPNILNRSISGLHVTTTSRKKQTSKSFSIPPHQNPNTSLYLSVSEPLFKFPIDSPVQTRKPHATTKRQIQNIRNTVPEVYDSYSHDNSSAITPYIRPAVLYGDSDTRVDVSLRFMKSNESCLRIGRTDDTHMWRSSECISANPRKSVRKSGGGDKKVVVRDEKLMQRLKNAEYDVVQQLVESLPVIDRSRVDIGQGGYEQSGGVWKGSLQKSTSKPGKLNIEHHLRWKESIQQRQPSKLSQGDSSQKSIPQSQHQTIYEGVPSRALVSFRNGYPTERDSFLSEAIRMAPLQVNPRIQHNPFISSPQLKPPKQHKKQNIATKPDSTINELISESPNEQYELITMQVTRKRIVPINGDEDDDICEDIRPSYDSFVRDVYEHEDEKILDLSEW